MEIDIDEERQRAARLRRLLEAESMKDVEGVGGRWHARRGKNRPGGRL